MFTPQIFSVFSIIIIIIIVYNFYFIDFLLLANMSFPSKPTDRLPAGMRLLWHYREALFVPHRPKCWALSCTVMSRVTSWVTETADVHAGASEADNSNLPLGLNWWSLSSAVSHPELSRQADLGPQRCRLSRHGNLAQPRGTLTWILTSYEGCGQVMFMFSNVHHWIIYKRSLESCH